MKRFDESYLIGLAEGIQAQYLMSESFDDRLGPFWSVSYTEKGTAKISCEWSTGQKEIDNGRDTAPGCEEIFTEDFFYILESESENKFAKYVGDILDKLGETEYEV